VKNEGCKPAADSVLGAYEMSKLDLKKKYKDLYLPSAKTVSLVEVPALQFVMVDGQIEPGETPETSAAFHQAMMAVYGLAYTLKFNSKLRKENPIDYTVMALEGLWWTESGRFNFQSDEPWYCTMMVMQPDHIDGSMFAAALEQVRQKQENALLDKVRFERFEEGLAIQTMHIGPYADEPRTLAKMAAFAEEMGYTYRGKHHEIYLGDPRRAKPENLKTVLRQPVQRGQ
jgi:hypothetical protein